MPATTFLGALLFAYSITLFGEGKIGESGQYAVQAACILVFGSLGLYVQLRVLKDED